MLDNLKKQLIGISEAVNSFDSDAVQVIVVERVLDQLIGNSHKSNSGDRTIPENSVPSKPSSKRNNSKKAPGEPRPPGVTLLLRELISAAYFKTPRSINEVTDHFNANGTGPFYTYQVSGLLLALFKSGKLKREVSAETKRYVYFTGPA